MSDVTPGLPDPTEALPQAVDAAHESASDALTEAASGATEAVAETLPAAQEAVTQVLPDAPSAPTPPAPPTFAGAGAVATVPVFANGKPMLDAAGQPVSEKSRLAAAILCWFLGVLGIHRFYVGKIGTGVLMILTFGGLGIWALIDFVVILIGSFRDKEGKALQNW